MKWTWYLHVWMTAGFFLHMYGLLSVLMDHCEYGAALYFWFALSIVRNFDLLKLKVHVILKV